MVTLPPLATVITFGTFFIALALVIYRLLWAGAGLAGTGMLPRRLQNLRRLLQGEPAYKNPQ